MYKRGTYNLAEALEMTPEQIEAANQITSDLENTKADPEKNEEVFLSALEGQDVKVALLTSFRMGYAVGVSESFASLANALNGVVEPPSVGGH